MYFPNSTARSITLLGRAILSSDFQKLFALMATEELGRGTWDASLVSYYAKAFGQEFMDRGDVDL